MRLAVNYSPQAAGLVTAGAVPLDTWKCSDWPELIEGARRTGLPQYIHFDLDAGTGDLESSADFDRVILACADSQTPFVNLHVAVRRVDFPDVPVESDRPGHMELAFGTTARDINAACVRFGPDRVIIENLPYRGPEGARLRLGQDPVFIQRLCDETGCGLLLEIAHARSAADYFGLDERVYLSSLPVDRLRELHISGLLHDDGGGVRDEHMPLSDHDWNLLSWCLEQIRLGHWARPWVLAFEYGGIGPRAEGRSEASVLAAQVPRLYGLIQPEEES